MWGSIVWTLVHALVCGTLVGIILIQRDSQSKSDASGFIPRGSANIMTYVTAVIAVLFIGEVLISTVYMDRVTQVRMVQ